MGSYVFYRALLTRVDPNRKLIMAVPFNVLTSTLDEPISRPVLEDLEVPLLAFDPHQEVIVKWIN